MANIASKEKIKQRKSDILEAAMDEFAAKGFHKAGIADIAANLRVGHGTIYRYYKNKREILDAVLQKGLAKTIKVLVKNPPNANSFEEYCRQLTSISNGLTKIFIDDPRLVKIIFQQMSGVDPQLHKRFKDLIALTTKEYLKNGVDKCFLRQGMNQTVASYMVASMLIEIITQVVDEDPTTISIDEWNQEMLAIMINGISL